VTEAEFQDFLDAISVCFIDRNFAKWSALVRLPFTFVTKEGPVLLSSQAELQANFDHYLTAMEIMKLDTVLRQPVSLVDCSDGTFIGTYRTELLSRGKRATEPYTSSALVHPSQTGWQMSSIMNARGHHDWTSHSPATKRDRND
jgi:hypothetical protein